MAETTTKTETYPTWRKVESGRWESEEQMDGTPDYIAIQQGRGQGWWLKWRSSAQAVVGFRTFADVKDYVAEQEAALTADAQTRLSDVSKLVAQTKIMDALPLPLKLERKNQPEGGIVSDTVSVTPAIDEDYWEYRVVLSEKPFQAVVGFPKFGTVGIGFAKEKKSWNTNLPYRQPAEDIAKHIWKNRGKSKPSRERVIEAIQMIQAAATEDRAVTS